MTLIIAIRLRISVNLCYYVSAGFLVMVEHEFGGVWSRLKLDVLEGYLTQWLNVMKNQKFERVYIDAFAGTGRFTPKDSEVSIDGSAVRALRCDGFDHYHFFEKNPEFAAELRGECESNEFSHKHTNVWCGDGADLLAKALETHDWNRTRAVLFLDPYGMEVTWAMLEAISKTQAIDVWYLFPISGVFRNAAKDFNSVDAGKAAAITKVLGSDEWMTDFYQEAPQDDLFSDLPVLERTIDVDGIESYVKQKLRTVFPTVLNPKRLTTDKNVPLYSLFFAVSNPSDKARGAASRIAGHLIRNA